MGELPELLDRLLHLARQLVEHLRPGGRIVRDDVAGQTEVDGQGHQMLLRTVVEIALDPPPFGVAARHDPRPGLAEGVRLLAQLVERGLERRVELRIVERQPDLAGQVGEHAVVVFGEAGRPRRPARRRRAPAAPRRG